VFAVRNAGRATLVYATSIHPGGFDAGKLLKETMARFGGKGGGSELMAQGALADPATAKEAVRWAAERIIEG
jgi:alanyl-tRNA synthetase